MVEKIEPTAKTSELSKKLQGIASKVGFGKKYLLIIAAHNKDLQKAARNLAGIKLLTADLLNVVDLLNHDAIVEKEALSIIERTYLKKNKE